MNRILGISVLGNVLVAALVTGGIGCSDASPETSPPTMSTPNDGAPGVDLPGQSPGVAALQPPPGPGTGATACSFETRSLDVIEGRIVDSITFGGRIFNFESNGAGWQNNGQDLTDIPSYASGPCRGRARGQCKLDTRTFVPVNDTLVESVTAYGSYWSFDAKGVATSTDLALMPRYQTGGPCEGRAPGTCKFDTRTFQVIGTDVVESITAYGKTFDYGIDGTPLPGSGQDLTTIPRYAAGPCAGKAAGQCVFNTRLLEEIAGHVLETVTAQGKVFHYEANGAAAFAEVQPSNVAVTTIEPWASGVCKH
jgi:hypothetical protein